nr:MAG TPA: hypothetical protein [Caudoviricetes sp.]
MRIIRAPPTAWATISTPSGSAPSRARAHTGPYSCRGTR